jgi:hypothetical protein
MIATSEDRDQDLPARLMMPALLILLGFMTVQGFVVNGLLAMKTFWGPPGRMVLGSVAIDLLIVGAILGVSRLKPSRLKTIVLMLLLGFAALLGFGGFSAMTRNLLANDLLGLWYWKTLGLLAGNVVAFAGAIWGLWRLKPWAAFNGPTEPVSPGTRRMNTFMGLSGVVAALGVMVLIFGTRSAENPYGLFSNGPVSRGIALFAISCWLLSSVLNKWYWYFSADEHERKADDVGNLLGWALFMIVTPAWWVAARAGLLPQLDAMLLWVVAMAVSATGYFWRRSS